MWSGRQLEPCAFRDPLSSTARGKENTLPNFTWRDARILAILALTGLLIGCIELPCL